MKVGDNIRTINAKWSFSGEVSQNFVEHAVKSIPFYHEGHDLICELSDFFCSDESVCYELGVSTGELIAKLSKHNAAKKNIEWIGLDLEPDMLAKAKAHCAEWPNIKLVQADVTQFDYRKSDMIVAYYTAQFIPEKQRQILFDLIYDRLNWGGAFVLFEKVRAPDARFQDMMTSLYNDFKERQGFKAHEILNKTKSLKNALKPFSTEGNRGLLARAGFVDIMTVMKYVSFEGFLAIK